MVSMVQKFRFVYKDKDREAAGEVFFESGIQKYRVAYQSDLIVIRELFESIGAKSGPLYVQETEQGQSVLDPELIQEIGVGLEDVDFFPDSFWVSYLENEVGYSAQFIKRGNVYSMIYAIFPGLSRVELPFIITKAFSGDTTLWQQASPLIKPDWFDKITQAIENYEDSKE